ncbi:beta-lactamase/transpeptidase-like protein [Xylariomycetidae sp. FL0641]|nr:beta-lactamase/transpeptidase-like protein [Xylariomycetidae sp. FL0641]
MEPELQARLLAARASIDQICQESGVPGASIGVIHNGEVIHTINHGVSTVKTGAPTTSKTVYGIGSVTKSFISAAIAQLVAEGHLSWQTPVKQILPELQHADPTINNSMTITDILSHRCGLGGFGAMNLAFQGDGNMLLPKNSLFRLFNEFPVMFPLRQGWEYFVWGYALAGAVIERVTQKSLQEYLKDAIFDPLGMNDTSFHPRDFPQGQLAGPHAGLADGSAHPLDQLQAFEGTFFEASGGLYSSLDDQLTWASATLRGIEKTQDPASPRDEPPLLKELPYITRAHATMAPPPHDHAYALGWARAQLPGAAGLLGDNAGLWDTDSQPLLGSRAQPMLMLYHQGATAGYYTSASLFPATRSAVVVLTNAIAPSDAADWLARTVIQALFGFDEEEKDYVALAREAQRRAVRQYAELGAAIAGMRAAAAAAAEEEEEEGLRRYHGRYVNRSELFCIDICAHPNNSSTLTLKFQGRASQAYALRRLRGRVFEWSLAHDEAKRRGRYHDARVGMYLFEFKVDGEGEVCALEWANDPARPDVPEVFFKTGYTETVHTGEEEEEEEDEA